VIPCAGPSTTNVVTEEEYSVGLGKLSGREGRPEQHEDSARLFYILGGEGELRVGGSMEGPDVVSPGELLGDAGRYDGFETVALAPGMLISIRNDVPYQLCAGSSEVSFLVIRTRATLQPMR